MLNMCEDRIGSCEVFSVTSAEDILTKNLKHFEFFFIGDLVVSKSILISPYVCFGAYNEIIIINNNTSGSGFLSKP